jgi:hypothetical protein
MNNENKRKVTKRKNSEELYVDALQDNYSKLCTVRVDLFCDKNDKGKADVSYEEANNDFNRLMSNRRSKPTIFKNNVGYICKKEDTPDRGVHFHTVFFFDGQAVKQDVHKAKQIGEYWSKEIRKDKGHYHNCNLNADKNYGDNNGIGMLDYRDTKKRKNLDKAIGYMCKDEQNIEDTTDSKKNRSIVRGTMPKKKGKIGRPRKSNKDS